MFSFAAAFVEMMTDKHVHILEAAEDLFANKGFDGTSVRDIASEAGVNLAMISYYFGSKEKLMAALVEYRANYTKGLLEELSSNETLTPWDKVDRLVDLYVEKILNNYKFHRIMTTHLLTIQSSEIKDMITDIKSRSYDEVRKIIHEGQRKKIFRKVDVELTVGTVMGTINHVTLSKNLYCNLLDVNINDDEAYRKKMVPKIKTHLKQLLRAHLDIKNQE